MRQAWLKAAQGMHTPIEGFLVMSYEANFTHELANFTPATHVTNPDDSENDREYTLGGTDLCIKDSTHPTGMCR